MNSSRLRLVPFALLLAACGMTSQAFQPPGADGALDDATNIGADSTVATDVTPLDTAEQPDESFADVIAPLDEPDAVAGEDAVADVIAIDAVVPAEATVDVVTVPDVIVTGPDVVVAPDVMTVRDTGLPSTCAIDFDCRAGGQVCDPISRRCVECVSATQCSSVDQVCAANHCVPRCTNDRDCGTGRACGADQACFTLVCTPNNVTCLSTTALQVCSPDGRTLTTSSCGPSARCTNNACVTLACTPNAVTCNTDISRSVCNADGSAATVSSCESGFVCDAGVCRAPSCTVGANTCVSRTQLRACQSAVTGYETITCTAGTACSGGACIAQRCTPGSHNCTASNGVRTCASDGLGYVDTACPAAQTCSSGTCIAQACVPGAIACGDTTHRTVCNTAGTATVVTACPTGTTCTAGACTSMCNPGDYTCVTNTTGVGSSYCPSTGMPTAPAACVAHANANPGCTAGRCSITCSPGFADCNGGIADGCEAALATSALDCGTCGHACDATQTCVNGTCGCPAGTTACGTTCTNRSTDVTNCGACGTVCPTVSGGNQLPTCTASNCGRVCVTGYADCDHAGGNGCEANTASDVNNCGACGNVCSSGRCTSGRCGILLDQLGGAAGFGINQLPYNDDGFSATAIDLTPAFPNGLAIGAGATPLTSIWVNNNGILTFTSGLSSFTATDLYQHAVDIAPFWADVDTRGGGGPTQNVVAWDVRAGQFTATWFRVGYFASHDDLQNSFQAIVRARTDVASDAFDIEFRYERCQWTTGDASSGVNGLGGAPARAGIAFSTADYVELPGSGTATVLALCTTSNVGQPGVWRYQVRSGALVH